MHCHLDFAASGADAARRLQGSVAAFSATVDPRDFERARALFAGCPHVRTGLGLHPWQAAHADFAEQTERFVEKASACAFIGEVGLDFSPKHVSTRDAQREAFERVVRACAEARAGYGGGATHGGVFGEGCGLVSIHAVHAVDEAIDAFERAGALSDADTGRPASLGGRALVFHSFNGTSDQLQRAVKAGFFFSVGPRMLATKRGRAYVRAIPVDRIMLETDMPSRACAPFSAKAWMAALEGALSSLCEARGQEAFAIKDALAKTSARILGI